jgi:hypothetical protein
MAYTLETIRNKVKSRIQDQDFDNTLINDFINDEQRELFAYYDLPFNRTTQSVLINQGEHSFALPAGHQKTKALNVIAPENYDRELSQWYLPYNRFKEQFRPQDFVSETQLKWWTIYDDSIIFSNNADAQYTLEHDYLVAPTELVNNEDVPRLPEAYGEILVLGAMIRCHELNEDNDIATYQLAKKNQLVSAMLKRVSPQQSAKTGILRNSRRGI